MQDTNQPPHPANNDYAVGLIQEEMDRAESDAKYYKALGFESDVDANNKIWHILNELLEKLKS